MVSKDERAQDRGVGVVLRTHCISISVLQSAGLHSVPGLISPIPSHPSFLPILQG